PTFAYAQSKVTARNVFARGPAGIVYRQKYKMITEAEVFSKGPDILCLHGPCRRKPVGLENIADALAHLLHSPHKRCYLMRVMSVIVNDKPFSVVKMYVKPPLESVELIEDTCNIFK